VNLTGELMQETITFGGLPMRRCDVYQYVSKQIGPEAADFFAFGPTTKPTDHIPLSLEEFEAIVDGFRRSVTERADKFEKDERHDNTRSRGLDQ